MPKRTAMLVNAEHLKATLMAHILESNAEELALIAEKILDAECYTDGTNEFALEVDTATLSVNELGLLRPN